MITPVHLLECGHWAEGMPLAPPPAFVECDAHGQPVMVFATLACTVPLLPVLPRWAEFSWDDIEVIMPEPEPQEQAGRPIADLKVAGGQL